MTRLVKACMYCKAHEYYDTDDTPTEVTTGVCGNSFICNLEYIIQLAPVMEERAFNSTLERYVGDSHSGLKSRR